jgi:hypothetical protein
MSLKLIALFCFRCHFDRAAGNVQGREREIYTYTKRTMQVYRSLTIVRDDMHFYFSPHPKNLLIL